MSLIRSKKKVVVARFLKCIICIVCVCQEEWICVGWMREP